MREYLLVAVMAGVITFVATPAVRWLAIRFGAFTPVRGRDVHTTPIPRLGGIGMLVGFAAALLVADRLPYLSRTISDNFGPLIGVLVAATLITALGAVDDFRELDPITKFAGQMIAAGVMAYAGVTMVNIPIGVQTILPAPILVGITILIVIATTTAVNFVDGLDGLAAGIVAIAGLTFFLWTYSLASRSEPGSVFSSAAFIAAALVGICVGFLPHNFHPARLFMGDAGALLLGLLLSAATISFTGNFDPAASTGPAANFASWLPIALPVLILALPIIDVVWAVVRRRGKFWTADSKHLHHRMLQMGHPHREAVLLLYLWSAAGAIGILALAYLPAILAVTVLFVLLAVSLALTWGLPRWRRTRSL